MLPEILLMILLGAIKFLRRHDLRHNRFIKSLLHILLRLLRCLALLFRMIKDSGTILRSHRGCASRGHSAFGITSMISKCESTHITSRSEFSAMHIPSE